jgi:SPP1 gp7 family putative phage head morphogenesis protein
MFTTRTTCEAFLGRVTVNPFVSDAQRKACYAGAMPGVDCAEWERKTKGKLIRKKSTHVRNSNLKYDPSRTLHLRQQLTAELKRRFARLRGELRKLIVEMDAFGLVANCGGVGGTPGPCPESKGNMLTRTVARIKAKIAEKYKKLEARYGPRFAKAIIGAALAGLPVPLPGASIMAAAPMLALAELHHQITMTRNEDSTIIAGIALRAADTRRVLMLQRSDTKEWEFPGGHVKQGETVEQGAIREWQEETGLTFHGELLPMWQWASPTYNGHYVGMLAEIPTEIVLNAFCPTGPGGGQDNSCSSTHADMYHASPSEHESSILEHGIRVSQPESKWQRDEPATNVLPTETAALALPVEIVLPAETAALSWVAPHDVEKLALRPAVRANLAVILPMLRMDTDERESFELGLVEEEARKLVAELGVTINKTFAFVTDPEKVKQFQAWLKTQIRGKLTDEQLWQRYAQAGFRKGAARSYDDVAAKLPKTESADFYKGSRAQFLETSFNRPEAIDKVKLLAGRSYDDMLGVTDTMATRMSRKLVDGLTEGKNPREIGADIADEIGVAQSRATTIARTEIIRAHAEGQLEALEALGVDEVGVEVEFTTADDEDVCPECDDLSEDVYPIDDAHNVIPVHPNCRCCFIPAGKALTGNLLLVNRFCPTGPGGGVDASCTQGAGERVAMKVYRRAVAVAIAKFRMASKPTPEDVAKAQEGIAKLGANKYRRNLVGNTSDRRGRREKLLKEFGNGKVCPCIYCGVKLKDGTMEQDKLYTTAQGGKYRTPNLVPACRSCNAARGDKPFSSIVGRLRNAAT